MANNNWNNYTEKNAALTDKDEIMLRDSTDGKNKRSPLSKIWNYMVDKMATAVISNLRLIIRQSLEPLTIYMARQEKCM